VYYTPGWLAEFYKHSFGRKIFINQRCSKKGIVCVKALRDIIEHFSFLFNDYVLI